MKRKLVTGQESEAGLDQLPRSKLSQNSVLPEGWRARRPSLASRRMESMTTKRESESTVNGRFTAQK